MAAGQAQRMATRTYYEVGRTTVTQDAEPAELFASRIDRIAV